MKCPNCGSELKADVYNVFPRIVFCLYCESGDFSTEYTLPSLAVAEVESAYKWNEQRRKENDYDLQAMQIHNRVHGASRRFGASV